MDEARYRAAEQALWASMPVDPGAVCEWSVDLPRSGARIRVQEVGTGRPTVFIHGASNAGASWASLVGRLGALRCILVDRPGCGLSPPLAQGFGDMQALDTFADGFVVDVLDALDLDDADLVGTSFGGYFALRAAAAHPARTGRLVLLSWSLGAPAEVAPLMMRIATLPVLGKAAARIPPSERAVRMLLRQIGLGRALETGQFGPVEMAWFLSLLRDTNTLRNEIDAVPRVMTLRGFDDNTLLAPSVLASVTCPTYLLWGADDPMGGEAIARAFTAGLPEATLEMMPDAGHAPWMDDPDAVADRLGAFLQP